MKYLCIGDPHFKVNNIPDVEIFIKEVENLLKQRKDIDKIIVLGDLLDQHQRLNVFPYNKALEFIKMLSSYHFTYSIVGNHDAYCNSIFFTNQHWQNSMKEWNNVIVVDDVVLDKDDNNLILIPYVPDGRFIEALNLKLGDSWKTKKCIFAHQTISGAKMGAIVADNKDKWDENFPRIISGHIHNSQSLYNGKVYYTGSSMQHAFGETDDKSLCIYDSEKDTIEEVFLNLPKRKIININEENIKSVSETLSKQIEKNKDISHLKVQIHGTNDFFNTFKKSTYYKDLVDKDIKIIYKSTNKKEFNRNFDYNSKKDDFKTILFNLIKDDDNCKKIYNTLFGGEHKSTYENDDEEEIEIEIEI